MKRPNLTAPSRLCSRSLGFRLNAESERYEMKHKKHRVQKYHNGVQNTTVAQRQADLVGLLFPVARKHVQVRVEKCFRCLK